MKVRVFKKEDGSIAYDYPSEKYQGAIDDCKIPDHLKDLPFFIADQDDLPVANSRTGDHIEKIYIDGDCCLQSLKKDSNWESRIMPTFLIRTKYADRLTRKIDEELKSESPDAVRLIALFVEREKCHKLTDQEVYRIALKNIEEDGHQKTLVIEKLNAKLKEATHE